MNNFKGNEWRDGIYAEEKKFGGMAYAQTQVA